MRLLLKYCQRLQRFRRTFAQLTTAIVQIIKIITFQNRGLIRYDIYVYDNVT
jgi:hypothetical protein